MEKKSFRDKLATVDEKGKRIWIFPKKPSGYWFNKRKLVSYSLLIFLFIAPFISYKGYPLLLFNIIERKFVIFGKVFWPQDFYILAVVILTSIVFVILFTLVFGRLFCGWVCPQTIFMELVFRRIEYWIEGDWTRQKKLSAQNWNTEKILKKTTKHLIFWLISFIISNLFLSYIISVDSLLEIITDPISKHLSGFIAILVFASVFYGVFAFLREQVCTTICPYGRLQGVLLDPDSMVITYDYVRGEDRSKFRKNEDRKIENKGDCIDCGQCVNVCPTGIDIRNGTQLECVNCTACIDACDFMMEKTGLDKGLIRYASDRSIKQNSRFIFTSKAKAYSVILLLLIILLSFLIISRSNYMTQVISTRSNSLFQEKNDKITNLFEFLFINKSNKSIKFNIKAINNPNAKITLIVDSMKCAPQSRYESIMLVEIDKKYIEYSTNKIKLGVYDENKELISTENFIFNGPGKIKY